MNAAAQHNKSAKRNIKSTLYPFEAMAKTIADKIITKKTDNFLIAFGVSLKNLPPLIIKRLDIAFINVSTLLTTSEIASTNIDIVKMELEPVMGFKINEKKTVLGSLAFPVATEIIPKKPRIKRKGNIIKNAEANPITRSLLLFAE